MDLLIAEPLEAEVLQWLDARHNGYDEPFGLTHRRRLFLTADGLELIGEETLSGRGGKSFAIKLDPTSGELTEVKKLP